VYRARSKIDQSWGANFTVGNSGIVNRFHALFHTDLDAATIAELGESPLPLPEISDHP
jgi:hypothetical protein